MNPITNFVFDATEGDARPVRVVMRDGEPWFLAADVAVVLGYRHVPSMVRMLDEDEKGVHNLHTLGGEQEVSIMNEPGLYAAILKSRRPEAKAFKKWVTAQVLPSIRKTGSYVDPSAALPPGEPPHRFLSHGADHMVAADRTFRSLVRSGLAAGLRHGAAIVRANTITAARTGINILEAMEVEPEQAKPPTGRGRKDTEELRSFWAALSAGFMGLNGPRPMLSTQAYELYCRWAYRNDAPPLCLADFVSGLRKMNLADTVRLRWRSVAGVKGQGTFLVPDGVRLFDTDAAVAFIEQILQTKN